MKMKKKWIGILLVIVGLAALVISHTIKSRVGEDMGNVNAIVSPLSRAGQGGRMAGGIIEERASGEASGYLKNAEFLMLGGIVLIIIGGCLIFFCKKKK